MELLCIILTAAILATAAAGFLAWAFLGYFRGCSSFGSAVIGSFGATVLVPGVLMLALGPYSLALSGLISAYIAYRALHAIKNRLDYKYYPSGIGTVYQETATDGEAAFCWASRCFIAISSLILSVLLFCIGLTNLDAISDATNSNSYSRTAGEYSIEITLNDAQPRAISSIEVTEGPGTPYLLPVSVFDDIREPHLGYGFKSDAFRFEIEGKQALVRISAGSQNSDEHVWLLSLPLKDVSRTTRVSNSTTYTQTRSVTPLLRK